MSLKVSGPSTYGDQCSIQIQIGKWRSHSIWRKLSQLIQTFRIWFRLRSRYRVRIWYVNHRLCPLTDIWIKIRPWWIRTTNQAIKIRSTHPRVSQSTQEKLRGRRLRSRTTNYRERSTTMAESLNYTCSQTLPPKTQACKDWNLKRVKIAMSRHHFTAQSNQADMISQRAWSKRRRKLSTKSRKNLHGPDSRGVRSHPSW